MKHTPATLRKLAADAGCTLDFERNLLYRVILDSPPGKIFRSSSCHCDAALHGNGFDVEDGKPDWNVTAQQMEAIIELGFEDCDDPDCETCEEGE